MAGSKELGALGEKIAVRYLEKKGYRILDKNYSSRFLSGPQRGEVDIVAKKNNVISFIEVKTLIKKNRGMSSVFSPEEKVDFQKQRKIIKTAENWLMERKIPLDSKWQIDIVAIKIDLNSKEAKVRHFTNIRF